MDIQILHEQVWSRFMRMPYCHLLDCADEQGRAVIPTAQECQAGLPTIVGWTTPIADCSFFGGLYLYGLCEKYDLEPSDSLREEILQVAKGLFLLCDIGKVDGFIARGVADDGVSHYPVSSDDQFTPWVLGLWRLMHSPVGDDALREQIRSRLIRTLRGAKAADWRVPAEWEGETICNLRGKDWRSAAMLLFVTSVACELGILSGTQWMALAQEKPEDSIYTRREIISHGFAPDMIRYTYLIQFWINVSSQIGLRHLMVFDVDHADDYRQGLHLNAAAAVEFLEHHKFYMQQRTEFEHDWRKILPEVQPWTTLDEAMEEGRRLNGLWASTYNKGRNPERGPLAQCIFGAWLAMLDTDRTTADHAYQSLLRAINEIDWAGVQHSYAFAVEAAIYCYKNNENRQ